MVEKKDVNNFLVASKKRVRVARTQCINKIVQKIRKVGELLEKHPDDTKNKDKLRKSEQVLLELKKVNHVNLLRKAIVYEGNPESIITNGLSTPEEVAEALFVSHAVIKEIVAEVKEKFLLNDELNPGWKELITAASKKSMKNEKLENRKRKRAEKKQKTAHEKKRLEWLKENKVEGSEDQEAEEPKVIPTPAKIISSPAKVKPSKQKKERVVRDEFEAPVAKKPKVVEPIVEKVEDPEDSEGDDSEEDDGYKNEVDEEQESEQEESEQEEAEDDSEEDEIPEPAEDEKMIDPFFTTETGEHYKATAVVERVQPGAKNDGLVRKDRRDNIMGRQSRPQKGRQQQSKPQRFENKKNTSEKIHPSWEAKQKQKGIGGFAGKKTSFGEDFSSKKDEKVHPSWAAKQKQKGIDKFAGKKISFGEDGDATAPAKSDEKIHPSWAAKQKQKGISGFAGKKISFGDDGEGAPSKPEQKVHPSWEAKQKQKGINGFAGKKTSFGDNDKKPDEKIHPSWAAKQKLKPVISSFQGKKISFDD